MSVKRFLCKVFGHKWKESYMFDAKCIRRTYKFCDRCGIPEQVYPK